MRMLLLVAAAITAVPAPHSMTVARATVRIERPAIVSEEAWRLARPGLQRRERVVRNERGEPRLLRLIEYE